jgi:hypothetical protein
MALERNPSWKAVTKTQYTCPMHPEVRGNKGDTCHRCGMELVKTDAAADSPNSLYRMQFTHGAIEPGKPVDRTSVV